MKRRWFIRICFMLPVLLCVGGWGWSTTHHLAFCYKNAFYHNNSGVVCGHIHWQWGQLVVSQPRDWSIASANLPFRVVPPEFFRLSGSGFLGFGYQHYSGTSLGTSYDWQAVDVPLWFPLGIFSGISWFVWRKTGKPKPGRAFPVEAKARTETKG